MTRSRQLLVALSLAAVTFAVYLKTAGFGLVNIDDYEYLVGEGGVTGGMSLANLSWAFRSTGHAIWMPLTFSSYMLDISLFGRGCWGAMHLHGAALHAVNAALLYALFHALVGYARVAPFRRIAISTVATLLWSLHPLRVESVAWLASRKDVLSFAFELLAMHAWISVSCKDKTDGRSILAYSASLLCFALSAMAKPSVMTFPLLMLLVDAFVIRRIRPWMYLLAALIMVVVGFEASAIQSIGGATGDFAGCPLYYRLLNAMSAFGIYVTNTVWPAHLGPQCMNRYPAPPRELVAGVVLSLVAGVWLLSRFCRIWNGRRALFVRSRTEDAWEYAGTTDWLLVGVAWFVVGIGPFLGIANFGYHAFADRFTYIPAVGLSLAAVSVMLRARRSLFLFLAAVPAFSFATWRQVDAWRDDMSVWSAAMAADGDGNAVAHGGLGMCAFEFAHDLETACREFGLVRELNPRAYLNCVQIHVFALCELGREQEAFEALQWYRRRMEECKESYKRANAAQYEATGVIPGLGNLRYAEIAYAICYTPKRAWARRELDRLAASGEMTPALAYLIYRDGVVSGDEDRRAHGLEALRASKDIDYFQFRYLKNKQGENR